MEITELASSLRSAVGTLHKVLRKRSGIVQNYSMTETETIGHLYRNERLLPTELAGLTRVTTQSMSQILAKMENLGIIEKSPSKTDKRKTYISLTKLGKEAVVTTISERDEWLKNTIENLLSVKEKEQISKALPILLKLSESI